MSNTSIDDNHKGRGKFPSFGLFCLFNEIEFKSIEYVLVVVVAAVIISTIKAFFSTHFAEHVKIGCNILREQHACDVHIRVDHIT